MNRELVSRSLETHLRLLPLLGPAASRRPAVITLRSPRFVRVLHRGLLAEWLGTAAVPAIESTVWLVDQTLYVTGPPGVVINGQSRDKAVRILDRLAVRRGVAEPAGVRESVWVSLIHAGQFATWCAVRDSPAEQVRWLEHGRCAATGLGIGLGHVTYDSWPRGLLIVDLTVAHAAREAGIGRPCTALAAWLAEQNAALVGLEAAADWDRRRTAPTVHELAIVLRVALDTVVHELPLRVFPAETVRAGVPSLTAWLLAYAGVLTETTRAAELASGVPVMWRSGATLFGWVGSSATDGAVELAVACSYRCTCAGDGPGFGRLGGLAVHQPLNPRSTYRKRDTRGQPKRGSRHGHQPNTQPATRRTDLRRGMVVHGHSRDMVVSRCAARSPIVA